MVMMHFVKMLSKTSFFVGIFLTFSILPVFAGSVSTCPAPSHFADGTSVLGETATLRSDLKAVFELPLPACGAIQESTHGLYRKSEVASWVKQVGADHLPGLSLSGLVDEVMRMSSYPGAEVSSFPALKANLLAAKRAFPGKEKFLKALHASVTERVPSSQREEFSRFLQRDPCL